MEQGLHDDYISQILSDSHGRLWFAGNPVYQLRVREITQGMREAAGELEHIIWAMNPKHDTLVGLAHRTCQYAEEYFADIPVQCLFESLPELPAQ
jgi:hypothetical protein